MADDIGDYYERIRKADLPPPRCKFTFERVGVAEVEWWAEGYNNWIKDPSQPWPEASVNTSPLGASVLQLRLCTGQWLAMRFKRFKAGSRKPVSIDDLIWAAKFDPL
jgi:hypothetical protein